VLVYGWFILMYLTLFLPHTVSTYSFIAAIEKTIGSSFSFLICRLQNATFCTFHVIRIDRMSIFMGIPIGSICAIIMCCSLCM
jgi:hypothetical protein